ncbi:MAG: transcriptional regulator [Candidatus Thermoplasmatota archaeon]
MERIDILRSVRDILVKAGFYVSDMYPIRLQGFDLITRRDDTLLIVKVLSNIDALSPEVADELLKLSRLLRATPLLIGERTGLNDLEDNVVYYRFGIRVITVKTLSDYLLEGVPITVYAAPGGLYVNLDEEKLRLMRMSKGLSLGSFARCINISRRTAQLYEKGEMNARVEIASRIEELLEASFTIPIDILSPPILKEEHNFNTYNRRIDTYEEFKREIFSLIERIGYQIIPLERCPFEAVSKKKEKVLLTCVDKYNKKLVVKAQIVSSISRITERYAMIITDKETDKTNVEGTPIMHKKELKKIRDPDEMIKLILERI